MILNNNNNGIFFYRIRTIRSIWAVSFAHISTRKQPIQEGDMQFESPKCSLKSGLLTVFEMLK
jgi:hypothetical protein